MRIRAGLAVAVLSSLTTLVIAAPAGAQSYAEPSAPPVASSAPAGGSPAPAASSPASGTASVRTTGMIDTDLVLPIQSDMTSITDSGYELRFQDAELDTLNITLTVSDGQVTDAFVGVGVPGTSIFEPAYFADFVHTQCTVDVTTLDATGVVGTIACTDLGNGDGTGTISLDAAFDTGVIAAATPSAAPGY